MARASAWITAAALTLTASVVEAQLVTRVVALSGWEAPGTDDELFHDFRTPSYYLPPVVNSRGVVAFAASARSSSAAAGVTGIWSLVGDQTSLLARTSSAVPGLGPDWYFRSIASQGNTCGPYEATQYLLVAEEADSIVFSAALQYEGSASVACYETTAVMQSVDGETHVALQGGDPSPGVLNGVFGSLVDEKNHSNDRPGSCLAIAPNGSMVFVCTLYASDTDITPSHVQSGPDATSMWHIHDGRIDPVALSGDRLPSGDGAMGFGIRRDRYMVYPSINRYEEVAFGTVEVGGASGRVLRYREGAIVEVPTCWRDQTSGNINCPSVNYYRSSPVISDEGDIALIGTVPHYFGDDLRSLYGIWATDAGETYPVAIVGNDLAHIDACLLMSIDSYGIAFDGDGRLYFHGSTRETAGLWVHDAEDRSCEPLVDSTWLAVGEDSPFVHFDNFTVNRRGDALFVATLADESSGLWLYSAERRQVFKLASPGQMIDASVEQDGSDQRILHSGSTYSVDFDGLDGSDSLSDAGHVAVTLRFTDGSSGVFVMRLPGKCPADLTSDTTCAPGEPDGLVTLTDFSCFLSLWSTGDPIADVTRNDTCLPASGGDGVSLSDFSCYLSVWSKGCP